MISEKMAKAIACQINREIYSAYFYLGMASFAASKGFKGVENWFKCQWKEELFHADKMFNYVLSRGKRVMLKAIEEPPQDFSSIPELFERTLSHERKVTGLINDLAELAKSESDEESEKFLQWYVKEQKEEEEAPEKIIGTMKSKEIKDVDSELAKRR